jgi:hypothetical protein
MFIKTIITIIVVIPIIIIIILNLFSPIIRWRSSVESRSLQEIKAIYLSIL